MAPRVGREESGMSFGPEPPLPPEPPPWPGQEPPSTSPAWPGATQPWPGGNQQWPSGNQQWPSGNQEWPGAGQQGPGASQQWQAQEQYAVRPEQPRWEPLPQPGMVMQPVVVPRSPAASVVLSVFIPGLGSMVNGHVGTGVAILVLNLLGLLLTLVIIGIPIMIGTWIWGLVDAYRSAQRWNAAHGIMG
jgi:TM2 domain-containing membrane protein YozV